MQDLACLANVYSSIDSVHHGMLNVVALILARPDDDRKLDEILAVDVLASFARAKYPLPLLLTEARKALADCESLAPALALSALQSFATLEALDEELLAAFLPRALGSAESSNPGLQQVCSTASWAWEALSQLEKVGVDSAFMPQEVEVEHANEHMGKLAVRDTPLPSMTGQEALDRIAQILSNSLRACDLRMLRLIQTADGTSMCILVADGRPVQLQSKKLLTSALLLTHEKVEAYCSLAGELMAAATGSALQTAWTVEQQVLWLQVAVEAAEAAPTVSKAELVLPLLKAFPSHAPHLLIPEAACLAGMFPRLLMLGPASQAAVTESSIALAEAVRPDLFRLRVREARQVLEAYLQLPALLTEAQSQALQPYASALFQSILDSFPVKLKSEGVFHRRAACLLVGKNRSQNRS